jgi:hypothetical protein
VGLPPWKDRFHVLMPEPGKKESAYVLSSVVLGSTQRVYANNRRNSGIADRIQDISLGLFKSQKAVAG